MSMMGLMMEFEPPFVPTMKIKKLKTDKKSLKSTPFFKCSAVATPLCANDDFFPFLTHQQDIVSGGFRWFTRE